MHHRSFHDSASRARSSSGFGRGGFRGAPRTGPRGRGRTERIDIGKYVNKAVPAEHVETFVPAHAFADFKIHESLKRAIGAKGYRTPTPIQDKAIPHALRGADILGVANTGTGKTGAFLIPLIHKVELEPKTQVLIVVPTRELALQIESELKGFVAGMGAPRRIFSVSCVGGASLGAQIRELRYHNNFIIGTPGRLKDLIERKMIDLGKFSAVVLDEADRMLDMGFLPDMRFIMRGVPAERQTLFFSATLSPDIERLVGEFLKSPVKVSVKTGDTSKNVEQDVVRVGKGEKIEMLHDLLNKKEFAKVLIFGRTKHGVERLSKTLVERGFKAQSIHGNKNHAQRQRALGSFKENKVQVLVATDVAARGLDIPDVTHVINYDIPATHTDYVHRIGRTGRGDKRGVALTFIE
ncbi:MAG: DEAD/DEAH box helicase [bacterium]|nr:DEAD/DEAH box helicase [bacterium]